MIKQKISELLQNFDSDVQQVVESVIQVEYSQLEKKKPKGIYGLIQKIIEEKVKRNETRVS